MNPTLGKVLKLFTGKTLFSKAAHNEVITHLNPFLNGKMMFGNKLDFQIGTNQAVWTIPDPRIWAAGGSSSGLGMHPFKIYATGETSGGNIGYNVRVGTVELRPLYHAVGTINSFLHTDNSGFFGIRAIPQFVDDASQAPEYLPSPLPTAQFYLDPTDEVSSGSHYGAYHSFWLEITPDTNNGGAYNGTAKIKTQRFSVNPTGSPLDPFPGMPDGSGKENLPIGIVQLLAPTSITPKFNVPGFVNDGLIWQIQSNNFIDRFSAGVRDGANGFRWWGDWNQTGNKEGTRIWYPGDTVYFTGTPGDALNGIYIAPIVFASGGTPASPYDTGMQFVHISTIDI